MPNGKGTAITVEVPGRPGWVRLVCGRESYALLAEDAEDLARELREAAARARQLPHEPTPDGGTTGRA